MAGPGNSFSSSYVDDLRGNFDEFAKNGCITVDEFSGIMKTRGEIVPQFKLRQLTAEHSSLDFDSFLQFFSKLSTEAVGEKFKTVIDKPRDVNETGVSELAADGTKHSFSDDEHQGFSDFLNTLGDDPDLKGS